jgi:NAD(P)-dependent dehydrogenase (short-subunit alcohol dehydrogenase family)
MGMSQLEKKGAVLVTGSSGGIGSALVRQLDDLGWQVFAGVRSLEAGRRLAEGRKNIIPVELDVCDEKSIATASEEVSRHVKQAGLFALINNAGLSADGPLELLPIETLRKQFEVNVIGQVAVTQAFLPLLRLAKGRVINIGGVAGRMTLPMYGALSASKAALDSLSNAFRMELKYQGVAVSYIEPGGLQNDFFKKSAEAANRSGYSGNRETQQIYTQAIQVSTKALAASKAEPVSVALAAIVKALSSSQPAPRYVVGSQAKMSALLAKLPTRLRERLIMSAFGLTEGVFKHQRNGGS